MVVEKLIEVNVGRKLRFFSRVYNFTDSLENMVFNFTTITLFRQAEKQPQMYYAGVKFKAKLY